MSEQKIVSTPENRRVGSTEDVAPWNPYQIFGFVFIATSILVGIVLGINWKRLRKPEWQMTTILLSVFVPVLTISLTLVWINFFAAHREFPIQLALSVPYLAFGVNFGYIWALARLQNGAYKVYETQGLEALAKYEYDLEGAAIFGSGVALVIGIGFTFIFPWLKGA